jgi:hypothetical protein
LTARRPKVDSAMSERRQNSVISARIWSFFMESGLGCRWATELWLACPITLCPTGKMASKTPTGRSRRRCRAASARPAAKCGKMLTSRARRSRRRDREPSGAEVGLVTARRGLSDGEAVNLCLRAHVTKSLVRLDEQINRLVDRNRNCKGADRQQHLACDLDGRRRTHREMSGSAPSCVGAHGRYARRNLNPWGKNPVQFADRSV